MRIHQIIRNVATGVMLLVLPALLPKTASAQSNNDGGRPALTVRRDRQSTSSKPRSSSKSKATTQDKAAKTNTATKAAADTKAKANPTIPARTAPAAATGKDNGKTTRPKFVPRRQTTAAKPQQVSDDRAQLDFPVAPDMPKDVSWRRDIYRSIDLTQDANATLYYPLEQEGDQINLFTYIFRLIMRGQIKAYAYTLSGNEKFDDANIVKAKELLDRYHIYYETKDGRTHINDSDIPAAEVTEYFIKESSYFDQRTATFHTKVVALCPVLKRADDFGGADARYPMFWVKYSDLEPYLTKLPLTGSNYNNAATMSADDYFAMNRYKGKIYKTNNLQGRVLANYCTTDSAMTKEQNKIEKQLTDFEQHIWGKDSADSAKMKKDTVAPTDKKSRRTLSSRRRSNSDSGSVSGSRKSRGANSGSGAARVTVRRQRH